MQACVDGPPARGDHIYCSHADPHQADGRGGVFVFGIQVDAQLGLGGGFAVQHKAVRQQVYSAFGHGGCAFALQIGAPAAKAGPAGPVAVHHHAGLGFHSSSRRGAGVPAHAQGVKGGQRYGGAGVAPIGHMPAGDKVQHNAPVGNGNVIQLAPHKRFGFMQDKSVLTFHRFAALSGWYQTEVCPCCSIRSLISSSRRAVMVFSRWNALSSAG